MTKRPYRCAMLLLAVGAVIGAGSPGSRGSGDRAADAAQDDVAWVAVERAPLLALVDAEGSPVFAELFRGTAVRVIERQEGRARVALEGWVADGHLTEVSPLPEEPVPSAPPAPNVDPPPPLTPVFDLAEAHHVKVTTTVQGAASARELKVELAFATMRQRPVIPKATRIEGRVVVFEQRRIAGSRVRGDSLLEKPVTFIDGAATLVIPWSELPRVPGFVLVSASATVSAARSLHGAATDVELAGRPPARR